MRACKLSYWPKRRKNDLFFPSNTSFGSLINMLTDNEKVAKTNGIKQRGLKQLLI